METKWLDLAERWGWPSVFLVVIVFLFWKWVLPRFDAQTKYLIDTIAKHEVRDAAREKNFLEALERQSEGFDKVLGGLEALKDIQRGRRS